MAWMPVEPTATLVTGTSTVVAPGGTNSVAGTVATDVSSDLRLNTSPLAGAGIGSVKARVWVVPIPVMVNAEGEKPGVPVIQTTWLIPAKPAAEAEMVTDPADNPVSCGGRTRVVAPSRINIKVGEIVAFEVSLLLRLTKTPPTGAGCDNVTGNPTWSPMIRVTPEGKRSPVPELTVTVAEVLVTVPPVDPAVTIAEPPPTAVTVTVAAVVPAAIVTVAGTVTAPVLLDVKVSANPPAGAAAERVSWRLPVAPAVSASAAGETLTLSAVCTGWTWTAWLADV
jgi:hypothetical protein